VDFWDATKQLWRDCSSIEEAITICQGFRDNLLKKAKITLRPYQTEISNKIIEYFLTAKLEGTEMSVLQSRQSGKTETVADTVLTLGIFFIGIVVEDFTCGLFAPVESMITHVTRNRIRERYKKMRKYLYSRGILLVAGEGVTSSLFILRSTKTDCEARMRSLSAGESAAIIGETFKLMIIEQTELISSFKLKNDIFPMGAEQAGLTIMTGTCSAELRNEYFKMAVEQYSEDPLRSASTSDYVKCVDWREAARHSRKYKAYVTKQKEKLGENSIEFRTQYVLEWVGLKVKFTDWDTLAALEAIYKPNKERLRFFGIDIGKADSTVVTIIEINGTQIHIIAWLELQGLDYERQIPEIANFLKKYAPLRYGLMDARAVGEPVFDMLYKKIRRFAPLEDYFGSPKLNDAMYKDMDREFVHSRVHYPKETKYTREKNKFIEQMLDLERNYSGNLLKLEHPKIRGRHDDYPQSLALAIFAFKEKSFEPGAAFLEF